jgi:hypothetical protein
MHLKLGTYDKHCAKCVAVRLYREQQQREYLLALERKTHVHE